MRGTNKQGTGMSRPTGNYDQTDLDSSEILNVRNHFLESEVRRLNHAATPKKYLGSFFAQTLTV